MEQHWAESQDIVDAYLRNELSDSRKFQYDYHLKSCESCSNRISVFQNIYLAIRENARQELKNELSIKLILEKKDPKPKQKSR